MQGIPIRPAFPEAGVKAHQQHAEDQQLEQGARTAGEDADHQGEHNGRQVVDPPQEQQRRVVDGLGHVEHVGHGGSVARLGRVGRVAKVAVFGGNAGD